MDNGFSTDVETGVDKHGLTGLSFPGSQKLRVAARASSINRLHTGRVVHMGD